MTTTVAAATTTPHEDLFGPPPWVPERQIRAVLCGTYFDAIRVTPDLVRDVQRRLGYDIGPVVNSAYAGTWHFLIPLLPGASPAWDVKGSRLLRRGTPLALPPANVTTSRDLRWVVSPKKPLTCPRALREALTGTDLITRPRRRSPSAPK
ncbi:hypothetical protein [Streptomyces millisiae]|uniref:Uncharacterized protein n=1 Tax=Streptomyces millisiae TaxID=3075542 RepID=A0ABU2LXG2_9ACTN|nr:hypothetical protein [Streptomyces sp. DSM 44918]MDT0321882.1 hypothetical protein [Streptomyces sp. DSM 44918]